MGKKNRKILELPNIKGGYNTVGLTLERASSMITIRIPKNHIVKVIICPPKKKSNKQ